MMDNMEFLCEMWKISAEEYMEFLARYNINCIGVHIVFRDQMVIFVDEAKYLHLSLNDKNFSQAEKQIIKLLERSEKLLGKFTEITNKFQTREERMDEEFEEEFEESFQQYDEDE